MINRTGYGKRAGMPGISTKKFFERKQRTPEPLSLDSITKETGEHFHGILRANLYELNIKKNRYEELAEQKRRLRKALRNCGIGDIHAKEYVKYSITEMLAEKYQIDSRNIEELIPFSDRKRLSSQDKFEILLFIYKKEYQGNALEKLIVLNGIMEKESEISEDSVQEEVYEITDEDIDEAYSRTNTGLTFLEKLEIVTQRIYQEYKGLGVIDEIRDMKIDGVSGGVSGLSEDEKSVWLFYKGKSIYLPFLAFGSRRELERVCRNICRYQHPGQLSETRGYIVNEMADHSRVVVARPPFSENWVFFVRKFDSIEFRSMEDLLVDKNSHIPVTLIKWLIKGCRVVAVTGAQGSGKTTLLMSMIEFISPVHTLRVQEQAFELNLRRTYPKRNIVSFRETESISGHAGLDLQKKTDGAVNILGEVVSHEVAGWMIRMGQTGSLFTLFTHHATTSRNLVLALRNSLLYAGNFNREDVAEQQVVDVVSFDVHMNRDKDGHRYVERITEIIPLETPDENGHYFREEDLLVFLEGSYFFKNPMSERSEWEIKRFLTKEERKCFDEELSLSFSGI